MFLGCIADDLTGATDIALMLSRSGMRTVQCQGVPVDAADLKQFDAVVVALKSRTVPAGEAVARSLAAAQFLLSSGAKRLYFKYCSTFDSTDSGNIGPVIDALMDFVEARITIACPAFPAAGRSVYKSHLFVHDVLLSESGMRDHPLTPMRDADLRRVLSKQTTRAITHIHFDEVDRGPEAIATVLKRDENAGQRIAILDALTEDHLRAICVAAIDLPLITGGSGLAIGLAEAYRAAGLLLPSDQSADTFKAPGGRSIILAGSCSVATREQVRTAISEGLPALKIDPIAIVEKRLTPQTVLEWLGAQPVDRPVLVYSTDDPASVTRIQKTLGGDRAGRIVEDFLASIAAALPDKGFRRFLVAGGETSGAVVAALGVRTLAIGPEIAPGIPWTISRSGPHVALALKSGNFGAPDIFLNAWSKLQ